MSELPEILDAIVVGAGWAGLTCARSLQAAGWNVRILEKSRGWGGRAARRRLLPEGMAEHGLPALAEGWPAIDALITLGRDRGLLELWRAEHWQWTEGQIQPRSLPPQWIAPAGLSGLARAYGEGIPVEVQQRASQVTWQGDRWQVQTDQGDCYAARHLGLFVPAPQAQELLPLDLQPASLGTACYDPCITVIACYGDRSLELPGSQMEGWTIAAAEPRDWRWLALDSSKRREPSETVVVLHSSAAWAEAHFEDSDLIQAGHSLLQSVEADLALSLEQPRSLQVHRWRYAFPQITVPESMLTLRDRGVCGGDWCRGTAMASNLPIGGNAFVAQAIASGEAGAQQLLMAD
ncbi:NAD(P)/FAD-dependent oxidoreductase [Synechococcus elongatus]|uniref:FAD-dependent oxidoreductase n=1 Tax=Synechococcus elongatus PCC 11801 TaxID=2219813 RepID=A0AAQ3REM5_SYNEL